MSSGAEPAEVSGLILVVDDDPHIRETTKDLLELSGGRVLIAGSGHEAARLLEQQQVDLIVTDMIMPDGDGYWLLQHIRATPALRQAKVIALSARTEPADVARGLRAGADAYLTKPYAIDEFLNAVNHWLAQARATGST